MSFQIEEFIFFAATMLLISLLLTSLIALKIGFRHREHQMARLRAIMVNSTILLLIPLWITGIFSNYWAMLPLLLFLLWTIRKTIEDLVAGAFLFISNPITLGDLLEIDNILGEVIEIGVRALVLRRADAAEIRIPFHLILHSPLMNHHHATADIPIEVDLPIQNGSYTRQLEYAAMCAATSPYASLHKHPETYLQTSKQGANTWIRVRGYVFDSTFAEAFRSHIVEAWLELK